MAADKRCFFNAERPCDLTCKAAFEVDDPIDNVDCHFIWLAYHLGESLHEFKRVLEGFGGIVPGGFPGFGMGDPGQGSGPGPAPSGPPGGGAPKGPKGFSPN